MLCKINPNLPNEINLNFRKLTINKASIKIINKKKTL